MYVCMYINDIAALTIGLKFAICLYQESVGNFRTNITTKTHNNIHIYLRDLSKTKEINSALSLTIICFHLQPVLEI